MADVDSRVALIQRLSGRLHAFLAGLSQDQWSRPSACDLWEVRDVVGHLTGGAGRQIESMRRGLNGDSAPPPGFEPMDAATLSATNARRDRALRERLGEQLLATFAARYGELGELLDEYGSHGWETPCWHARRGVMTGADYADLRIQELAIHDWGIRSAFHAEATLDPESVAPLLDIASAWLQMTFRPGPRLDAPLVYRFDLMGPAGLLLDVTVAGDDFQIAPAGGFLADAVVRCDADSYLLYLYGRFIASAGRLAVEGEPFLMRRFEEWFKGL